MTMLEVFGFRNAIRNLRLTNGISATIRAADAATVSASQSGYYQSVEEHQSCCNYK